MFAYTLDALLLLLLGAAVGGLVAGAFTAYMVRYSARLQRPAARQAAAAGTPSAASPAARADTPPAAPHQGGAGTPALLPQAADLLLVDDSAVARTKLRKLFEPAGYNVHLARDGVEALALMEKGRYALMITDLEMPNMDGIELIDHCVRQPQTRGMPILAISGHENLRAKFNECRDVCGVHRKPWVDDILLSHVATLVTRPLPQGHRVSA
jgi:CheY-like chemotaxis protein